MNPCQETSGFLFSHRCGRPGVLVCMRCHKYVCQQHARSRGPDGMLCVTCARGDVAAGGGSDSDSDDNDDPYFYSSRYRQRSGRKNDDDGDDPVDFTEGDQSALETGGDWGDDMGGS